MNVKRFLCKTANVVPTVVPRIVIKLERKFGFYIVTARLNGYFSESSNTTECRYPRSSLGKSRLSSKNIKNEKKDNNRAARRRLRVLPEWLKEFTDDLDDTA